MASPDVGSASLLRSTRIWPPEAPPCRLSRAECIAGLTEANASEEKTIFNDKHEPRQLHIGVYGRVGVIHASH